MMYNRPNLSLIIAILVVGIIASCNSKKESESSSVVEIAEPSHEIVYDSTMYIGSVKVGFSDIAVPSYYGQKWKDYSPEAERKRLKGNQFVYRDSLSLNFKLLNGKRKSFIDIPFLEEATEYDPIAESVSFTYQGEIKNADAYQIDASCYEYYYKIALDKVNGDTLKGIGDFACSADGKWMISYNFDLEAAFTPNGIELFHKEGARYKRVATKLFTTWGITKAVWLNDSVVKLKVNQFDKDWNQRWRYVKMTILN